MPEGWLWARIKAAAFVLQRLGHDHPWIDRTLVDGAPKERLIGQHTMTAVKKDGGENLAAFAIELGPQEGFDQIGAGQGVTTAKDATFDDLHRAGDDPVFVLGIQHLKQRKALSRATRAALMVSPDEWEAFPRRETLRVVDDWHIRCRRNGRRPRMG